VRLYMPRYAALEGREMGPAQRAGVERPGGLSGLATQGRSAALVYLYIAAPCLKGASRRSPTAVHPTAGLSILSITRRLASGTSL
jgi:hypothetical protein